MAHLEHAMSTESTGMLVMLTGSYMKTSRRPRTII